MIIATTATTAAIVKMLFPLIGFPVLPLYIPELTIALNFLLTTIIFTTPSPSMEKTSVTTVPLSSEVTNGLFMSLRLLPQISITAPTIS